MTPREQAIARTVAVFHDSQNRGVTPIYDALVDAYEIVLDREATLRAADEFEKRTRHHLSEFTAACNRADAAEFALADAQARIAELEKSLESARAHAREIIARHDDEAATRI